MISLKKQKQSFIRKPNKAFIMLFTIIFTTILLAMAIGASNIALKEINFSTSARSTNDAFFAADLGAECALFNDKSGNDKFPLPSSSPTAINSCAGLSPTPTLSGVTANTATYSFTLSGFGTNNNSCAKVSVLKDNSSGTLKATITSDGYNVGDATCASSSSARVARELRVTYGGAPTARNVTWKNIVGVIASTNNLTKNTADGWNTGGASSNESIAGGDGYIEFSTNENNTYRMVGFNNSDLDRNYPEMEHIIYLTNSGTVVIYEYVNSVGGSIGTFSTYVAGDIFRIAIESGVVKYYKNGSVMYTSTRSPVYPIYFDDSMYSLNSTVINAKIYP